ncbi:MAG: hypothetical protein ISS43_02465 [Candidatus Omnitrophica bacterium]|nr:hypothetical protein [Candidatus Omnitrophota bacterium]
MKKIWVNKATSFKAAKQFDDNYYLAISGIKRIETMQILREMHFKIKGFKNAGRKRLRRVIKVIQ